MAAPNPNSIYSMNNLVLSLDIFEEIIDFSSASKEYALGLSTETRDLDLGYGLCNVETTNPNLIQKILVLGKGYEKSLTESKAAEILSTSLDEVASISIYPNYNSYDLIQRKLISGSPEIISNCFAFGSVFLESYNSGGDHFNTVSAATLKGNNGYTTFISKDIDIEEAMSLMKNNMLGTITPKSLASDGDYDNYSSLPVFDFVLDIEYFDGTFQNSRVYLYLMDKRKVRGVFPFALETLSVYFVPSIVRNDRNLNSKYNSTRNKIKNIIKQWVLIPSWSPDFITYWRSAPVEVPARIKEYLKSELGIIIWNGNII